MISFLYKSHNESILSRKRKNICFDRVNGVFSCSVLSPLNTKFNEDLY